MAIKCFERIWSFFPTLAVPGLPYNDLDVPFLLAS
jgi:hypothetical protein